MFSRTWTAVGAAVMLSVSAAHPTKAQDENQGTTTTVPDTETLPAVEVVTTPEPPPEADTSLASDASTTVETPSAPDSA